MSDTDLTYEGNSIISQGVRIHPIKSAPLALFLIGLGLTFFLTFYFQIPKLSLENHHYSFAVLPFLLTLIGSCIVLFLL